MTLEKIEKQALGIDNSQLCELNQTPGRVLLHREVIKPLLCLQESASKAGFDLQIVSAWRSYDRQLAIWNAKALGERPVLDSFGIPVDISMLDNEKLMRLIMRWSAVPGLSRHHWGTDMDVFDANAMSIDDVQLVPDEVNAGGPCFTMHEWLTERIEKGESYGFFRPYNTDNGAIAPEKWHLSYYPLAKDYQRVIKPEMLPKIWEESKIELNDSLVTNITSFWDDFVDLEFDDSPAWIA